MTLFVLLHLCLFEEVSSHPNKFLSNQFHSHPFPKEDSLDYRMEPLEVDKYSKISINVIDHILNVKIFSAVFFILYSNFSIICFHLLCFFDLCSSFFFCRSLWFLWFFGFFFSPIFRITSISRVNGWIIWVALSFLIPTFAWLDCIQIIIQFIFSYAWSTTISHT